MQIDLDELPEKIMVTGVALTRKVFLNEIELDPAESQLVWNKSPDGFNWGYAGSGPAQLALAILLEYMREEEARTLFQKFKFNVVARLPQGADFHLELHLREVIKNMI